MTIGTALLQPQRFRRAPTRSADEALIDDFVHLATRLLFDPGQAQPVLHALEQAFAAMVQRFVQREGTDLDRAVERLRGWMKPLLDGLDAWQADLPELEDATDALELLASLTASLAQVAGSLTIDQLRPLMSELLEILESELGLTLEYVEEQVWAVIDEVIGTLRQVPPDTPRDARATRLALASFLGRVKRLVRDSIRLPPLDADRLADVVLGLLRRFGLDQFADKGSCIATAVSDLASAGTALAEVAGVTAFGSSTVGAAEAPDFGDEYRWYASWLLKDKSRPGAFALIDWLPGFPGDEVWRTKNGRQIVQRNVWRDDIVLHEGDNVEWHQAPLFSDPTREEHYTFTETLDPDFMEGWARHTSTWLADLPKLVLHFIQAFEKGDRASNISFVSWALANGVFEQIARRPFVSWLNSGFGGPQATRWPLGWFVPLAITFLAALESRHTKADEAKGMNWFILFLDDGLEALTYDTIANVVRDVFLSIFTLINYKKGEHRPLNGRHLDVLVTLALLGTNALLMLVIPREDYAHPFTGDAGRKVRMWLAFMVGLNLVFTSVGVVVAVLIAFIFMRSADGSLFLKPLLGSNIRNIVLFWVSVFLSKEGNTGDGKYNPLGADFAGYPSHETSPYKLPYEKDKAVFCPQGNQGIISHNKIVNNVQVYAYDFALDQGEEILAARAGTVVDFFDWVPDNQNVNTPVPSGLPANEQPLAGQTQNDNWNFVLIRHDVDDSGSAVAPNPAHDRGAGGSTVTTYAVYGHGRQGSVRELLKPCTPGTRADQIIGLKVKQGQPIMRSGHTGISAMNHVHIQVQPGPTTAPPVMRGTLTDSSIPFVFREVTHLFGQDGVPRTFNFYTSDNERKTC